MKIRWVGRMAWRDSRRSRKQLFVFSLAIVLGVAALVGVRSFRENLEEAVENQARALLGADLVLTSRQAPGDEIEAFLDDIEGERASEVSFTSMALFPGPGQSRLVMVRALDGDFPWYGEIRAEPAGARQAWRRGEGVLVEKSLFDQLGLAPGDPVRVGGKELEVAGALRQVPGEAVGVGQLAPRIFVPHTAVADTGLLTAGSLARYRYYYRFPDETAPDDWVAENRDKLSGLRLRAQTVEDRKEDLGDALGNLARFLNLSGLVALLLGGVGVAAGVYGYVSRKRDTAAILRCLGAGHREIFGIYLLQGGALGATGAFLGALLGIGVQAILPRLFEGLLPVEATFSLSWKAIAEGLFVGFGLCLLFALWPMAALRRIPPLRALRASVSARGAGRDPLQWFIAGLLGAAVFGFCWAQSENLRTAGGIFLGLAAVFLLLAGTGWLMLRGLRWARPSRGPFAWRQGVANLYRPNNRTVLLIVSLGLGTFLIGILAFSRGMLTDYIRFSDTEETPNFAFFDIQDDQLEGVRELLGEFDLPVLGETPIVTMRIESIRGRPVSELLRENEVPGWTLRREYRSTYRRELTDTERLIEGQWTEEAAGDGEPVPISVESGLAGDLNLEVGDEIVWDVQGLPLRSEVASLREVEWRRISPNFFVVFPAGVLEPAPKFHVVVTRTSSPGETGRVQIEAANRFSNVSAVDLRMLLNTVEEVLGRIGFVVRFMAGFTVVTGLLVLAAVAATGRYQRRREWCLLRTLGASSGQISGIRTVEFLVLGTLAATAGLVLATAGGWALGRFVFDLPFAPSAGVMFGCWAAVAGATVLVGWLNDLGSGRRPPLEVLRESGDG